MFERCLYFNSNHLARIVNGLWKDAYAEFGLAPSHAYLLRLVLEQPGLAQRDIAQELHLEKSTITRFIDKMVAEGYLRRQSANQGNQKEQLIYATAQAEAIGPELQAIGDQLYKKMQNALGESQVKELVELTREAGIKL